MKFYQKITSEVEIIPSLLFLATAHHPPCQLNRTWRFTIWGHKFYICTRCTGQYLGTLAALYLVLFGGFLVEGLLVKIILFGVFPLPATIDWLTQTLGQRESINSIRSTTGFLYGFSIGTSLACVLTLNWKALTFIVPVYTLYILFVMYLLVRLNVLKKYLMPYKSFLSMEQKHMEQKHKVQ